jgi:hypothetical protein
MKNITVLFKSGKEVTFQCREIEFVHNWAGDTIGWETAGLSGNNILYVDFSEVACVYERHGGQ